MTKDEFVKKVSSKLSHSYDKVQTVKEIILEIDNLTYQETNLPISKETKVELLEGLLISRFPFEKTKANIGRLVENSNEEYIKILTRSIEKNK